jgi:hypothetical protein
LKKTGAKINASSLLLLCKRGNSKGLCSSPEADLAMASEASYSSGSFPGVLAMWARVVVAIILLLLPAAAFAQTEKRIALLIGNKDYKTGVGALTNPLNDIRIVGEALKSIGFEVLKPTQNGTRTAMLRAVYEFAGKLKVAGPDAVGFFYYRGTVSHPPAKTT